MNPFHRSPAVSPEHIVYNFYRYYNHYGMRFDISLNLNLERIDNFANGLSY